MSEETKVVRLTNVEAVKKSILEFQDNFLETRKKFDKLCALNVWKFDINSNDNPDDLLLDARKMVMDLSALAHSFIFVCNAFLESRKDWRA